MKNRFSAINLLVVFSMFLAFSNPVTAGYKHFEAAIEESEWQFQGNPLGCYLSHSVPYYGTAQFQKTAGKSEQLAFQLSYKRQPIVGTKVADVRSLAASWHPFQNSRELGQAPIQPGPYIFKNEALATWRLLNELEIGRFPTFYYQDFADPQDQVAVSLSSIGFKKPYDKFLDCLATLVPFKLHELRRMTLNFDFDQAVVKKNYQDKLKALAQYIKHDPSVEVVFIAGYTDSKGTRYYNEKLSQKRVDSVMKILKLDGVPDSRFKTHAFGETQPKASNRTAKGRAQNRRVLVRLTQS